MALALGFTIFQLCWSALWGSLHAHIRRKRKYARGRPSVGRLDALYRALNPLLFVAQLGLTVTCLWSDSRWLLEFHDCAALRSFEAALLAIGLALTLNALQHFGVFGSHLLLSPAGGRPTRDAHELRRAT
jgi:hypothetical protein